jgi:hypothetical protein
MRLLRRTGSLARIRAGLPYVYAVLCLFVARPVHAADVLRPWTPPMADSIFAWSAEARAHFATNTGDSVGGPNFLAYQRVGQITRRLLRSLGPDNFLQAYAIVPVMDSLGLSTEVAVDPLLRQFVLVVVHNPIRRGTGTVGFLYWYHGDDLHYQGTYLDGGWHPKLRVWRSGHNDYPYECGILHRDLAGDRAPNFLLLRLAENGMFWNVSQYPGNGPDFGSRSNVDWVDADGDDRPEIVAWAPSPSDTLFEECSGCPPLMSQRLFVERTRGFELEDSKLVASPYATFQLFVRLLVEGNRTAATRLLADPAKATEALALGWGVRKKGKAWRFEYGESGETWPRWIVFRYLGTPEKTEYVVHFTQRDGRWVIADWILEKNARPKPPETKP